MLRTPAAGGAAFFTQEQFRKNKDVTRSHGFPFKIKIAFEPHSGGKTHILTTWIDYFFELKNAMRKLVLPLQLKNTIAKYI